MVLHSTEASMVVTFEVAFKVEGCKLVYYSVLKTKMESRLIVLIHLQWIIAELIVSRIFIHLGIIKFIITVNCPSTCNPLSNFFIVCSCLWCLEIYFSLLRVFPGRVCRFRMCVDVFMVWI